jgi:hypothetical protein
MGKDTFELGGQEWPKVTWWRMKGMRFVYLTLWAAMITSATNGSQNVISLKLSVADGNLQDTMVP